LIKEFDLLRLFRRYRIVFLRLPAAFWWRSGGVPAGDRFSVPLGIPCRNPGPVAKAWMSAWMSAWMKAWMVVM
jgi:hypothetical protein